MTRSCPRRPPTIPLACALALGAFAIVLGCAGPGSPASPTGLSCGTDAALCGTASNCTVQRSFGMQIAACTDPAQGACSLTTCSCAAGTACYLLVSSPTAPGFCFSPEQARRMCSDPALAAVAGGCDDGGTPAPFARCP